MLYASTVTLLSRKLGTPQSGFLWANGKGKLSWRKNKFYKPFQNVIFLEIKLMNERKKHFKTFMVIGQKYIKRFHWA
jgi:hypothetical protein